VYYIPLTEYYTNLPSTLKLTPTLRLVTQLLGLPHQRVERDKQV
jgi:hypothetical protein